MVRLLHPRTRPRSEQLLLNQDTKHYCGKGHTDGSCKLHTYYHYGVVHTDDIDRRSQNPKHRQLILKSRRMESDHTGVDFINPHITWCMISSRVMLHLDARKGKVVYRRGGTSMVHG